MSSYFCDLAWLPSGRLAADVVIDVEGDRLGRVAPGVDVPASAQRLRGLVLPGLANGHSHAFHRALRGRTHAGHGTFWTWRDRMYEVAAALDPDSYLALARACFAEMTLAGFTSVGEFHYLHHQQGGRPYADPNAMGRALIQAAREAGVRITLLDTCYVAGGIGRDTQGVQRRFDDGDARAWAARVEDLHRDHAGATDVRVGAAIHSVRAVPAEQIPLVASWAASRAAPLHVHVSEQPAENEQCLAGYGMTPTGLLASRGALSDRTTVVHATHLTAEDIRGLGESGTYACLCPTTERDLGDGVGPARDLLDAGVRLTLGSDSHASIDAFDEARALEGGLRLTTLQRGHLTVAELIAALGVDGQASLGFHDAGRLEPGARADLVAVDLKSVRTAGASASTAPAAVLFAAGPADVTDVIIGGRRVVRDRQHVLGDVGALLDDAIATVFDGERP
jgi:formiminoglutamate deiminase